MRAFICICVSLTLIAPQIALAGKKKSGGGGGGNAAAAQLGKGGGSRTAAHPGGGGGSRAAAHPGGGFLHSGAGAPHANRSGAPNHAGMGQHNFGGNNTHTSGLAAPTQHGLNANQGGGQHGLNANQPGGQHGLNASQQSGQQGLAASQQNGQQGLNANQQRGQQGFNSHQQAAAHGPNASIQASRQNNRAARLSPTHPVNNRSAVHNQAAAHWRSGLGYRNHHALYTGYHRAWHDRWYWHSHYNSVVYVGGPYWGGHWYWDGGYWFPAWGYNPGFVSYVYDGPIFAYNNLPPDEVVVNVQEALQDQGYYTGNIDGQLGDKTRDALATYQRDHQLEVTAAIDEPTVQSLGLVTEES
jgi:Putative peptidoglycan binding domain